MTDLTAPVKRKPGRPRKVVVDGCVDTVKAASVISDNELSAIHREAWEALDYDTPRGKTDSLGRIWSFDIDIKNGVKLVDIGVRRVGQAKHGTQIEVPNVGYQDARPVVEQIVNRLNVEVA